MLNKNTINIFRTEKGREKAALKEQNEGSQYDGFATDTISELAGTTVERVQAFEAKKLGFKERAKHIGRRAVGVYAPLPNRYDSREFGKNVKHGVNKAVEKNGGVMPIELYSVARDASTYNLQGHVKGLVITDSQRSEAFHASNSIVSHPSFIKNHTEAVQTLITSGVPTEHFMHDITHTDEGITYTLHEGYDKTSLADVNALLSDERMWQKVSEEPHKDLSRRSALSTLEDGFEELAARYPDALEALGETVYTTQIASHSHRSSR